MRLLLLLLPLLLSVPPATAAVYMEKDSEGNVIFTDKPSSPEAKPVELSPPSTYQPPALPAPPPRKPAAEPAAEAVYESVEIISPADDEPVRANDGRLSVSVEVSPPLKPGHRLELHMDGKKIAETRGDHFDLENIDRGTHSLQVQVVDEKGKTLISSKAITFHLLRYAIPRPATR